MLWGLVYIVRIGSRPVSPAKKNTKICNKYLFFSYLLCKFAYQFFDNIVMHIFPGVGIGRQVGLKLPWPCAVRVQVPSGEQILKFNI